MVAPQREAELHVNPMTYDGDEMGAEKMQLTAAQSRGFSFLRGIAAVVVLFAHLIQIFLYRLVGYRTGVGSFSGHAATLAVIFFFVISGFFITLSILKNRERNGRFNIGQFVRSRLMRIYPALIGSLVLCLAVYILVKGFGLHGDVSFRFPEDVALADVAREKIDFQWFPVLAAITFTGRLFWSDIPSLNGPLWSLMWEFWYYVAAMLAAAVVFNRSKMALIGVLGLVVCLRLAKDPMAFRLYGIWPRRIFVVGLISLRQMVGK